MLARKEKNQLSISSLALPKTKTNPSTPHSIGDQINSLPAKTRRATMNQTNISMI